MQSEQENGLPEDRKAAIAAGLEQFNLVAHERDELRREVRELRTQIAGLKVALEAMDGTNVDRESRLMSMQIERDQAVADRAVYETLFISIQAQLRAFAVPNTPLVREKNGDDYNDALAAMQESIPPSTYDYAARLGDRKFGESSHGPHIPAMPQSRRSS